MYNVSKQAKEVAPFDKTPVVYTIGHSNHSLEQFLKLLKQHGIQVVIDVRSYPYSRWVPHFNREILQKALKTQGIHYLFRGNLLGGRPQGQEFCNQKGEVLYKNLAKAPFFKRGLAEVLQLASSAKLVLMCSEENPHSCHRFLLIGKELLKKGVRVLNILRDGSLEEGKIEKKQEQLGLFEGNFSFSQPCNDF